MGWTDSHLHAFVGNECRYSAAYPDYDLDDDAVDERKGRLNDLVSQPKDHFVYEYDFGDNWEHVVEVVFVESPFIVFNGYDILKL